jgi:DNA-binding GntR family transcriptional regulator
MQYRKLNREFHETLVNGSRNYALIDIYWKLRRQISWYQNITLPLPHMTEIWLQEHKDILDALQKKDPEAAGKAATEHIRRAAGIYLATESQEG